MSRFLPTLAVLLAGCGPYMTDGELHWIHREGADMPVWIRGNVDSGVFLVFLHGGPGHDGQGTILSPGFHELEKDMAVVYWDQRASGMSQGNPSEDTYTVPDFVADTDAVLDLVQELHDPDVTVVIGHSWGGDLALATALDGANRDEVDGWILHAAAHDEQMALEASRAWVLDQIDENIRDGVDADFWRGVRQWYRDHPNLQPSNPDHWAFVSWNSGYFYDVDNYTPPPVVQLALASPFTMGVFENAAHSQILTEKLLDGFDVSDRLDEITAPALVLAGAEDGAVPAVVAEEIYAGLGTPDADKSLVVFPEVAHSVHDEDPDAFVDEVLAFFDRL